MKVGILIARMQVPEPHEGHRFLINRILERCDKLIILLGSANRARSVRNPYTYTERADSVFKCFNHDSRITVVPINDYMYNDSMWINDVSTTIKEVVSSVSDVTLFGHFKPGNDYLKWFPGMKFENIESEIDISGTEMRKVYEHLLPCSVQDDIAYFKNEQEKFANYPYAGHLNILCGDCVVECLGYVLLIKRGRAPGQGNWALPGGHKASDESTLDTAIRELYEETNLRVPEKVLRGSIKSTRFFDDPGRSPGAPRSTLAVHIVIPPNLDGSMPRANGRDDAVDCRWVPIGEALNDYRLHDDHGDIIREMTGVVPLPAIYNNSIL